jgi:chromosome segregation ATPase
MATTGVIIPILIALLGGGLLGTLYQIYAGHRRGPTEMQDIVTKISNQVMGGAKDLLDEYRIQLEASHRQVDAYLGQLTSLNRLLGESNARIARLEIELQTSVKERDTIRQELIEVRRHRDELAKEIEVLRRRLNELIDQVND